MYDRPFGVEIECGTPVIGTDHYGYATTAGQHGAANLLRNKFPTWAQRIGWDGTEIEIRSPILKGSQGMRELKGVMDLLKVNGYYTTDSDGMHCHFDVRDLNESDMIRVIKSWDRNQEVIKRFLGERWENGHCEPYNDCLETLDQPSGLWQFDGEKCFAIEPRHRFRTLEFRQHYGTLNFEDAQAWILLVQAFIKNVAQRKSPMKTVSMEDLFRITRVYKVAQRNLAEREF